VFAQLRSSQIRLKNTKSARAWASFGDVHKRHPYIFGSVARTPGVINTGRSYGSAVEIQLTKTRSPYDQAFHSAESSRFR
jgi:hypothetical protein